MYLGSVTQVRPDIPGQCGQQAHVMDGTNSPTHSQHLFKYIYHITQTAWQRIEQQKLDMYFFPSHLYVELKYTKDHTLSF